MKALDWWTRWSHRRAVARRAIPDLLWQSVLAQYTFLARRSPTDLRRLRELCSLFLDQKEFTTTRGLELSDEIAVTVAAQACLPVLNLGLEWYDGFVGIVIHPDEVLAPRELVDEAGVVHHYQEALAGEAMRGGPVMLSWTDVELSAEAQESGYNVVIHEFAHVLDMRKGSATGMPAIADRSLRDRFSQVARASYQRLCEAVDQGRPTLLDPYGAESPEEFFPVASEAFFVMPRELKADDEALYQVLGAFFQQDPANDQAPRDA